MTEDVMQRWQHILLLLLFAVLGWQGEVSILDENAVPYCHDAVPHCHDAVPHCHDGMLYGCYGDEHVQDGVVTMAERHCSGDALLSDGYDVYRICSSRPQRVLPSVGAKTQQSRTSPRHDQSFVPRYSFIQSCSCDCRCRRETAPFASFASRDYYVFALRRILC